MSGKSNITKSRRWLHAALAGMAALAALVSVQAAEPDSLQSLDGDWKFKWAADAKAADAYRWFGEEGFDTAAWDTIPVPSHWSLLGYEDPRWVNGSEAEGFYVRTFDVPAEAKGKKAFLRFGGVWVSAEVWLNGAPLGQHDSGFTAFSYDVTREIKAGETNVLKVRVRQQLPGNLFKFDANDDWGLAGIYRSVWLEYAPKDMYIESAQVETDFDDQFRDADLNLRVFIQRDEDGGYIDPSPPFGIKATLLGQDGKEVMSKTYTATVPGAHNGRDIRFTMHVPEPLRWTAETPNLYDLNVELIKDGSVHHAWRDRVGFREVSTAGGVLRVNGHPNI